MWAYIYRVVRTRNYNFGYHSTHDRLKGNDTGHLLFFWIFGSMIIFFGPVCIYLVVRFRSNDPVSKIVLFFFLEFCWFVDAGNNFWNVMGIEGEPPTPEQVAYIRNKIYNYIEDNGQGNIFGASFNDVTRLGFWGVVNKLTKAILWIYGDNTNDLNKCCDNVFILLLQY